MGEVLLPLPNTDRLQQVEVYVGDVAHDNWNGPKLFKFFIN